MMPNVNFNDDNNDDNDAMHAIDQLHSEDWP